MGHGDSGDVAVRGCDAHGGVDVCCVSQELGCREGNEFWCGFGAGGEFDQIYGVGDRCSGGGNLLEGRVATGGKSHCGVSFDDALCWWPTEDGYGTRFENSKKEGWPQGVVGDFECDGWAGGFDGIEALGPEV